MDIFTQFILDHADDDTGRLLLGRAHWPEIDMDLAVHTLEGRRRMRTKMPMWYAVPGLHYPTRLCTEQCSSAATARYKARVAARILTGSGPDGRKEEDIPSVTGCGPVAREGGRIADLTGGLGVDAWAFSEVAEEVLHNEMDPVLSEAVRHNFGLLDVRNVLFRNECAAPGRIADILGDFRPGLIYLDPARRAGDGRKVFRLEDCRPDVLSMKEELLRYSPNLLLKISPMADISLIIKQLDGGQVREVHVVEADGECKELLLWIDRDWNGPCRVIVCNAGQREPLTWSFGPDAEARAVPQFVSDASSLVGGLLFEPGKALSKAGVFNLLCSGTGLLKLSRHTHLYLVSPAGSPEDATPTVNGTTVKGGESLQSAAPGDATPTVNGTTVNGGGLLRFGKLFRIKEIHPFNGKTVKSVGKDWPRADVTAKDLPLSSDELRKRLGTVSDAAVHIFGCRITENAFRNTSGRRTKTGGATKDSACLLVTEPVSDRSTGSPDSSTGV